ncbi:hypothetical protein Btru_071777 [Bulinus truncatus]|nr:hypothetical protein Btru_071777 [Bulinus truncatus]
MAGMQILLAILLLSADLTESHSISWSEKPNNVDSLCGTGLVNEKDNIILYSRISMGSKNDLMDRVQFEIKKRDSVFETLCYLDVTNCQGYTLSNCYCSVKSEAYVVEAVINMTALTAISEATLRGTLYSFNNQIFSDEFKLPPIYDPSVSGFDVDVNGKKVIKNNCESKVSGKKVVILFQRPSHVILTHTLAVRDVTTNKTVKTASDFLTYSAKVSGLASVELISEISSTPHSRRTLLCNIKTEDACEEFHNRLTTFIVLFIIILIVFLCSSIAILWIWRKFDIVKKFKTGDEMEPSEAQLAKTSVEAVDEQMKQESNTLEIYKHSKAYESISMIPTDVIELKAIKKFLQIRKKKISDYDSLVKHQLCTMVRVTVTSTSRRRPSTWPGSKMPYPYYKSIDSETRRVGIGRIISAQIFNERNKEKSHIWKTEYPRFQKVEWVEVLVYASRHVVFDDIEVKHTSCTLLSNNDKQTALRFDGVKVLAANLAENWVLFTCYSCDLHCFDDLRINLENFQKDWIKYMEKFRNYENTNRYFGFQVTLSSGLRKEVNAKELLDIYIKDARHNKFSFTINTYFPYKQLAIYIERIDESFIYRYQQQRMFQFKSKLQKEPLIVGALPVIMSDSVQK